MGSRLHKLVKAGLLKRREEDSMWSRKVCAWRYYPVPPPTAKLTVAVVQADGDAAVSQALAAIPALFNGHGFPPP